MADTAAGVVEPNAAGDAQSAPSNESTLRLATLVVEAMTKGAVPVANVDVIAPVALKVLNAPVDAVVAPIVVALIVPPVIAAEELSVFVAIAVAILLYSVSISVPRTILSGSPGVRLSLVAKLVLFV